VRVPNRTTSELYTPTPQISGLKSLSVNGKKLTPVIDKGYAVITRDWKAGDTIELELPLAPQTVKASDKIAADRGLVALRYGPLVYNVERADNAEFGQPINPSAPLTTEWKGDLLSGVMIVKGSFADGKPLVAIPNYARNNRGSAESVGGDTSVDYSGNAASAGATSTNTAAGGGSGAGRGNRRQAASNVWVKGE
jgi:DUF1680 family protein